MAEHDTCADPDEAAELAEQLGDTLTGSPDALAAAALGLSLLVRLDRIATADEPGLVADVRANLKTMCAALMYFPLSALDEPIAAPARTH